MQAKKHSKLGIASFITSIASGAFIFLLVVIAAMMEASTLGGMDEQSAEAIIVGVLLFVFIGTSFMALGLGLAGLLPKDRKKIFAVLGMVFSTATLLSTASLLLIGLANG